MDPDPRLAEHFPDLAARARAVRTVDNGWDNVVLEVDDRWIVRLPRTDAVARWLPTEVRLLRELAGLLPVPVPLPEQVAGEDGSTGVAYRKLHGDPLDRHLDGCTSQPLARQLGRALAVLHSFPPSRALALGVRPPDEHVPVSAFRRVVVPLLEGTERNAAERLLDDARDDRATAFEPVLTHADLGPEHILCRDGRVTGIIDWTDARLDDPALDLSWLLSETPAAFAGAVVEAYGGVDDALRERAALRAAFFPWHEVLHGVENGLPEFVSSGLEVVRKRLAGR